MNLKNNHSDVAAFFDLDQTFIDANSGWLWAKYEYDCKNISKSQLARVAFWNLLYKLAIIDMDTAYAYVMKQYAHQSSEVLEKRTADWFSSHVESKLRPDAMRALKEHKQKGHHIVLLTSSSSYVANEAKRRWHFDEVLANQFPLDEQKRLVGTYVKPLCYGDGKLHYAQQWAHKHKVNLEQSYFYTDSYSDLALLKSVGHPCVVTPDIRLRRTAHKNHWPIFDWAIKPPSK